MGRVASAVGLEQRRNAPRYYLQTFERDVRPRELMPLLHRVGGVASGIRPAIAGIDNVMVNYIPPRHRDEDDNLKHAFENRLRGIGVHLTGEPKRQRECQKPNCLPDDFKEEHGQHL